MSHVSDDDDVTELIRSNVRLRQIMLKFETNIKKTGKPKITKGYLEARNTMISDYWNKFESTHHHIMSRVDEKEEQSLDYCSNNTYDVVEESYLNVVTYIKDRMEEICPSITNTSVMSPQVIQSINNSETIRPKVKLPEIKIPKFDGTYQAWPAFYDLFKSLIHTNLSITPVHKLHYLKSSLSGEADLLLRHYQVTDLNYAPAWETLIQRYENKHILLNDVLKSLFNQQRMSTDTANGIKSLLNTTKECLHSLRNLGINTDVDALDVILIYVIVQRLTPQSHMLWEQTLDDTREFPKFHNMVEFLEVRYRTLEIVSSNSSNQAFTPKQQSNQHGNNSRKTASYHASSSSTTIQKCALCSSDHNINRCEQFSTMSVPDRFELVTTKKLCTNCLSTTHTNSKCSSRHKCFKCKKRHHTLLHKSDDKPVNVQRNEPSVTPTTSTSSDLNSFHANNTIKSGNILLATAVVKVTTDAGQDFLLRALLDQGSQSSFITEEATQKLGLKRMKVSAIISGIGEGQTTSSNQVALHINAHFQQRLHLNINALVLRSLTKMLPATDLTCRDWPHITELTLADPDFATVSKIDLILGADAYAQVLLEGVRRGPVGSPIAQKTQLGWILSGSSNNATASTLSTYTVSMVSNMELSEQMEKFWEQEQLSTTRILTADELYCEDLYEETFTRNADGRCVVKLPFKQNFLSTSLGTSKQAAITRFYNMEKAFNHKPTFAQQYKSCLQEYISLHHMEIVPRQERCLLVNANDSTAGVKGCYLPHHGVIKESSTTTKLRVVFDASQSTSTGCSLNDVLLTGPRIQDDLISILTRWRKFKIAITADIEKMYRQVLVSTEDAEYQRIVWREDSNGTLEEYRLRTLTFGTSCAPYLAIKTMQHIAKLEETKYPLAAKAIYFNFYVDDLLSGADDIETAKLMQCQLVQLLQSAGFELRKWCSNSTKFLSNIPIDHRESIFPLNLNNEHNVKTLGIYWHPVLDTFQFKTWVTPVPEKLTKRVILSDISKLFDPSGWLAPVTITAKALMQSLWLTELQWDDPLPESVTTPWLAYRNQLHVVENIAINRWVGITNRLASVQLHTFCDASEIAYAAVVYLRTESENGEILVNIMAAKTKVAPLKRISLARLELCGASLAASLVARIKADLQIDDVELLAWTDSTIVLSWLRGHPQRWSTFVANRVVQIHSNIPVSSWNHVSGVDNPADCASRGILPTELENHPLWWKGPRWLRKNAEYWPRQPTIENTTLEMKRSVIQAHVVTVQPFFNELLNRFSTLTKLIRCTSYCRRFIDNCKQKSTKINGFLSIKELHECRMWLIKCMQQTEFPEIRQLQKGESLSTKAKTLNLTPFLDDIGVMRVGGRLQRSNIPYNAKHPIILSKKHRLTELIINYYHQYTQHGGCQLTQNVIRQEYWILDSRNTIRFQINKCIVCYRQKAIVHSQLMGQLPTARVNAHRPFLHTGVDYAGPMEIKWNKGRNTKTYKAYVALFVCLSVKCIHLEVVTDLTTNGFMAAYRRFVSRRGLCSDIYSDCGTNFIGAAKTLQNDFNRSKIESQMAEILANDGCNWHFIPPGSPNFGGLWEAGVKSMKQHLKRAVGNAMFTYEEFTTCLNQIEAVLNSRPLCPLSSDPKDLTALTPGHFLIGDVLVSTPQPNWLNTTINRLTRWQTIQQQFQNFWKRWHIEYLSNLQQRPKWLTKNRDIKINDLVLVKDDRMPPSKWLLGRIITTTTGADQLVRVASVRTKNGVISRAISKLCILPLETKQLNNQSPN